MCPCVFISPCVLQSWTWTAWRTTLMCGGVSHVITPPCFTVRLCGIPIPMWHCPLLPWCHNDHNSTTGRRKSGQRKNVRDAQIDIKAWECKWLKLRVILTPHSLFQPQLLRTLFQPLLVFQWIRPENTLQPDALFCCRSRQSPSSSCWSIEVWAQPSLPSTTQTDEELGGNQSNSEQ